MLTEKEIVTEKKAFFLILCVFFSCCKELNWVIKCCWLHTYVWSVHFLFYWLALLSTATATPGSFACWPNKTQIKKPKCTIDHFFTSSNQKWYFFWKVQLSLLQHQNEQKNTCNGSKTHQKASEAHYFFSVWLMKDGALLWLYSVFLQFILKDVPFDYLEPLKRKTNATLTP